MPGRTPFGTEEMAGHVAGTYGTKIAFMLCSRDIKMVMDWGEINQETVVATVRVNIC